MLSKLFQLVKAQKSYKAVKITHTFTFKPKLETGPLGLFCWPSHILRLLLSYCILQVSVQSIQADHNITLPFIYAANELTFEADGVAVITYNTSETSTWYINCWPKEVSYIHCDHIIIIANFTTV